MYTVTVNIKGEPETVTFTLTAEQAADPVQLHTIVNQYLADLYA